MGDGRLDGYSMRSCQDEGQQSVAKGCSSHNSYDKSHTTQSKPKPSKPSLPWIWSWLQISVSLY